jgi:hypothetical protein
MVYLLFFHCSQKKVKKKESKKEAKQGTDGELYKIGGFEKKKTKRATPS